MRMLGTATKFVDTLAAQMQKQREEAAAAEVDTRFVDDEEDVL